MVKKLMNRWFKGQIRFFGRRWSSPDPDNVVQGRRRRRLQRRQDRQRPVGRRGEFRHSR